MVITINQMSRVFQTEEIETTALNQVSLNVKKGSLSLLWGLQDAENQHC